MSLPVPAPSRGILGDAAVELIKARQSARLPTLEEMQALGEAVGNAGSAAERADLHVQLWRSGMAKLTLALVMSEELDPMRHQLERMEGWKELKRAALESTKVMAELRSYWNPEDKVEIRD
jgi:hypothetical protein